MAVKTIREAARSPVRHYRITTTPVGESVNQVTF
jgi:hypothetical protein